MCLDSIIKIYEPDNNQTRTVYKVLTIENRKLYTPYFYHKFQVNKWYKCETIDLYTNEMGQLYQSGFHCFEDIADASKIAKEFNEEGITCNVYEAIAKNILCDGVQYLKKTIVSQHLKIVRRLK